MRDMVGECIRDLSGGELGTVKETVSVKVQSIKVHDCLQREQFKRGIVTNVIRCDTRARRLVVRRSESQNVRQCAGNRRPNLTNS